MEIAVVSPTVIGMELFVHASPDTTMSQEHATSVPMAFTGMVLLALV
jgi:hypothetical protein